MDKAYLENYEAREKEEMNKFGEKFIQGRLGKEERYPPIHRLSLNEPYTKSIDGERIWTQIPLYGTTIINLKPTRKEFFKRIHGFDIEDIDRLIDFSKKTRRVQFAIAESPLNYMKMDFLEPLFKELEPPRLIYIPLDWILSSKDIELSYQELEIILDNAQANEFIMKYIEEKYQESITSIKEVKKGIIYDLMRLKCTGYRDLVNDITRRLTSMDISKIILLHETIHDIFLYPFDPLKGIKSFYRRDVHELNEYFPYTRNFHGKIELPCEIGKFLADRLKLIVAKDIDGAIALNDEYNLYDLRKVALALNNAVIRENTDEINRNSLELSLIFDNVWDDADELKKRISNIRYGISLGIGVLGAAATLPIAGMGGFFAGLGFEVADRCLEKMAYECISEKMSKLWSSSHVVHVYDFRKKYKLF
ncbi:Uncharacterised protein [uncultured archaeon]|nr:Uncharacterised protein [uncultured archaeon]